MSNGTSADIQTLQAEMNQLRTDFGKLSETLRDLVRHGGEETAAKARESGERIWAETKRNARSVSQEIEEKPITAAVAAFSVGVILGMLFGSRRA